MVLKNRRFLNIKNLLNFYMFFEFSSDKFTSNSDGKVTKKNSYNNSLHMLFNPSFIFMMMLYFLNFMNNFEH